MKVVPWMWLLNGKKHTTFAAAWTLVNAHELAVISGMAAAYRLGAEYPKDLEEDPFAMLCFRRETVAQYWSARELTFHSSVSTS